MIGRFQAPDNFLSGLHAALFYRIFTFSSIVCFFFEIFGLLFDTLSLCFYTAGEDRTERMTDEMLRGKGDV
jgi:hypothetical protein